MDFFRLKRTSLAVKLAFALLIVFAADLLVFGGWTGASSTVVTLAGVVALLACQPAVLRTRLSAAALAVAVAGVFLQLERPSLLGWAFVLTALGVATLAPRAPASEDAFGWLQRLAVAALRSIPGLPKDLARQQRARRHSTHRQPMNVVRLVVAMLLPVCGGLVFLALFATANPVIAHAFEGIELAEFDAPRLGFWLLAFVPAWALLRPRGLRRRASTSRSAAKGVLFPTASIVAALAVFNTLFALQNGLDLAFLWGGAQLPPGTTFAEYAHRGAYALIATALLAGAFVVVFLDPRSDASRSGAARALVTVWVAQNLFLVASTALRTLDYVEVYSLTRLRIAALAWMALVAVGLALICWRLLRRKSTSWLINANALAAALVLGASSAVDFGALAAAWNVRHAAEFGTGQARLDVCYLRELGPTALVPMAGIDLRLLQPNTAARLATARRDALRELEQNQTDWRTWTWRGARRLARARELLRGQPEPPAARCDDQAALTPAQQAGS